MTDLTFPSKLCQACGLCCNGKLFAWTKLRAVEMSPAREAGLRVIGSEPSQRGFNQPCSMWDGVCQIYDAPAYPRACKTYQCKLLKSLKDGAVEFDSALRTIEEAKEKIRQIETRLPASQNKNFRERLIAEVHRLEEKDLETELLKEAIELIGVYKGTFGVKDFI